MRNKLDEEHGEGGDGYARVVVQLNDKWRVVVCRSGIQWILQRRKGDGGGWAGRSFCRTGEAIKRVSRQHAGAIDAAALAVLDALPDWIEEMKPAPVEAEASGMEEAAE